MNDAAKLETLAALRGELDLVDEALLMTFVNRMKLVERISENKKDAKLPVRDTVREAWKLEQAAAVGGERFCAETVRLMEQMLAISRDYQSKHSRAADIP